MIEIVNHYKMKDNRREWRLKMKTERIVLAKRPVGLPTDEIFDMKLLK